MCVNDPTSAKVARAGRRMVAEQVVSGLAEAAGVTGLALKSQLGWELMGEQAGGLFPCP